MAWPWQITGHVSPKLLEILIVSKWSRLCDWLIYGHVICCLPEKTLGTRLGVPLALIEEPADSVQASTAVKRKSNYVTNLVSPESVYKEKFVRNI